jgi:hypothetical protein
LRLHNHVKDANHLLEQIMFLYEDSFVYEFDIFSNELDVVNRKRVILDFEFNRYTRIFFRSVFKLISILSKKGVYRTALEFNKLLLKMNPVQDPLGSMLYIDYNALCAKEFDFIINFANNFAFQYLTKSTEKNSRQSVALYPNIIYSVALSKFYKMLDSV